MTDANWGMGIGGTIAVVLIIVSLVLLIRELHEVYKNGWSSPRPKLPSPTPTPTPDSKALKILFSPYISFALLKTFSFFPIHSQSLFRVLTDV